MSKVLTLAVRRIVTRVEGQIARGEHCVSQALQCDEHAGVAGVAARHVGVVCNARWGSLGIFVVG